MGGLFSFQPEEGVQVLFRSSNYGRCGQNGYRIWAENARRQMSRSVVVWAGVALLVAGCAGGGGQGTRGTPTPLAGPSTPAPTSAVSPSGGSLGDLAQSPSPAASPLAQASPAEASPAPASPEARATPELKVDAVLARGITEEHEPREVTTQFTDADERIYVVHGASLPAGAYFTAKMVAVKAEGIEPNKIVETSCIPSGCGENSGANPVKEGRRSVVIIPAPLRGFPPGDYRVDLDVTCYQKEP